MKINIVIIIPTKDRPEKLDNLLDSLVLQDIPIKRIIIIDSGKANHGVLIRFQKKLPIEYYNVVTSGQIKQRNEGIKKLNNETNHVIFFDDDIVLEKNALSNMLNKIIYLNKSKESYAAIAFNIINELQPKYSLFRRLFFMYTFEPGKVLRSGYNSPIQGLNSDIRTEWVPGGATVWRQDILLRNHQEPIDTVWAPCEDLIFSYPIGRRNNLHVCSAARVRHEHPVRELNFNEYVIRGFQETAWRFYFVSLNSDLSLKCYYWMIFGQICGRLLKGLKFDGIRHFGFVCGQIKALYILTRAYCNEQSLTNILAD